MRYICLSHLICVILLIGLNGFILQSYGFPISIAAAAAATTQKNKNSRNTTNSLALDQHTPLWNKKVYSQNTAMFNRLDIVGGSSTASSSLSHEEEDARTNKYFLLNSKQIWKQIISNTIILFLLKYIISRFITPVASSCCNRYGLSSFSFMEHVSNINHDHVLPKTIVVTTTIMVKTLTNLFLPFMASACCAIQLILNSIGVGCAGFNTVLGPLRPYFVSVLIFTSIIEMPLMFTQGIHVVKFMGAWFFSLLPELIHFMNQRRVSKRRRRISSSRATARTTTSGASFLHSESKRILVHLNIPSMGCVACINKIDATIQNFENALDGSSKLNNIGKGGTGTVLLECSNDTNVGTITKKLVQSVTDAGFPCQIDNISIQE